MVPYLRAANVKDGRLDLSDVKEMNFGPAEQAVFSLRRGDVLVTEGSGSLGAVGASATWNGEFDGTVCLQNTLLRFRPRPSTDPRFLAWWCRHAFADGLFASIATGANIFHLSAERVRALPMAHLQLPHQRAIADFLDTEIARIDALIAKKRRMVALLGEEVRQARRSALTAGIEGLVGRHVGPPVVRPAADWVRRRLSTLVETPQGGVWGEAPGESDYNVACMRVADFDRWSATASSQDPTIRSIRSQQLDRLRLEPGDLLLEKSGGSEKQPVGFVARFVDLSLDTPTVCSNFVARLRPRRDVDAEYLSHLFAAIYDARLNVPYVKQTTGIQNLDVEAFLAQDWAIPARDQQRRIATELAALFEHLTHGRGLLKRQVDLLAEHRQALITAAVTGELDVPGVAA